MANNDLIFHPVQGVGACSEVVRDFGVLWFRLLEDMLKNTSLINR